MKSIITLTTDFGTQDGYVGAIKGVILSINPKAEIVDISHQIPAHNVLAGAFCLFNSGTFFPKGTIHVAIVDPRVGSKRNAFLLQTERYIFVGPDNGIFSLVLRQERLKQIIHLNNSKYFLGKTTPTFHGRDIFAPVAAYLSLGINPEEFGPELNHLEELPFPKIKKTGNKIIGRIIQVDNFGNLVSNVIAQDLDQFRIMRIKVKEYAISQLNRTFSDVKKGGLLAYIGSSGFLEIGIREGNARLKLNADIGDQIEIQL